MKDLYEKIDFEVLKKELLRGMRGGLTQAEVNNRMGLGFNQCAKWESGEKRVLWKEFVQLADAVEIDLRPMFVSPFRYFGDVDNSADLVKYLSGSRKGAEIARDIGVSRDKTGRWLSGKQDPTLEDVFAIIRCYYPYLLVNFIDGIIPLNEIPCMFKIYKNVMGFKEYFVKNPHIIAVSKVFELAEYKQLDRHVDGFVANKTGITLEQERDALKNLESFGMIRMKEGRYVLISSVIHYRMGYRFSKPVRHYFLGKTGEYIDKHEHMTPGCFMVYDCLAIPQENLRQVIDMCFEFYMKVNQLLEESEYEPKNLRLFNLNMFPPE